MTRKMADSTELLNLVPVAAQFDLLAGYDDGNWPDASSIAAAFPSKTVIRITVFASDNKGDCLDVETGDATPAQAPAWVAKRRAAGHGGPLVYCSESVWPDVRGAFTAQNVPEPGYWVAGYPGAEGDAIPTGAIGHQWIDRGPYDESVMVDYLPGIDPAPVPTPVPPVPPTKEENDTVFALIIGLNTHVYAVVNGVPCHWWQTTLGPDYTWHPEKLPVPA